MMKPYLDYKDSGIEWLGMVPKSWQIKRLGSLFNERREKVNDEDYPPLSVTKWGIIPQMEHVAKTDNNDNRKKVLEGDFVINSRSDRRGSSGISSLTGSVSLINTVLTPKGTAMISSYIHHLFRSIDFQEEYYIYGHGIVADLWTTNYGEMKTIMVPIPPISEQKSIVDYLNREMAEMDALITEQEELVSLLKQKRSAIISEAVCRGLDPTVPMKDSGVKWLGIVPKEYRITKIKFVALFNPSCKQKIGVNTKIGYLPMECVKNGYMMPRTIEYEKITSGLNFLENGDIVIAKVTPCFENGNIAIASGLEKGVGFGSSELFVFRCFDINNRFLFYCLQCHTLKSTCISTMTGTGGLKRISSSFIQNCCIPFPKDNIQQAIVDYLDRETSEIDHLIADCETSIQLLKQRRTALISEAVTGKIDVRTA